MPSWSVYKPVLALGDVLWLHPSTSFVQLLLCAQSPGFLQLTGAFTFTLNIACQEQQPQCHWFMILTLAIWLSISLDFLSSLPGSRPQTIIH